MTRRWQVTIPVAGQVTVEVEAPTREAAIEEALDSWFDYVDIQGLEELEGYRRLHSGNVCHISSAWEASAAPIEDDND